MLLTWWCKYQTPWSWSNFHLRKTILKLFCLLFGYKIPHEENLLRILFDDVYGEYIEKDGWDRYLTLIRQLWTVIWKNQITYAAKVIFQVFIIIAP